MHTDIIMPRLRQPAKKYGGSRKVWDRGNVQDGNIDTAGPGEGHGKESSRHGEYGPLKIHLEKL